jgi:hypothetical protein
MITPVSELLADLSAFIKAMALAWVFQFSP